MNINKDNLERKSLRILQRRRKSQDDIQTLFCKFRDLNFFQKFLKKDQKDIVFQLLCKLKYQKLKQGEIVFKQGSIAENFYIILSGQVYVMIENKDNNTIECQDKFFQNYHQNNPYFFDQENKKFKHQIVATLDKGKIFGELGIINNAPRLASIVIKSPLVEFAILQSEDFKNIIKSSISTTANKKFKFFNSLLGDTCDKNSIIEISAYFLKKKFQKGEYIFQENQLIKNLYLIHQGEVLITKQFPIDENNISQKQSIMNRKIYKNKFTQNIVTFGQANFLGSFEYLQGQSNFYFNAKSTQKTKVYYISKKNLKKCLKDFKNFGKLFEQQEQERLQLLKVIQKEQNFKYLNYEKKKFYQEIKYKQRNLTIQRKFNN